MSQTVTTTGESAHVSAAPGVFELRPWQGGPKNDSASFQEQGKVSPERQNEDDATPPSDAQTITERWNYPRGNIGKMAFAFVSFTVAGMNDAAIGVCIFRDRRACIYND